MTGLQFDDRLWVCGYCKAVCVDYPTMKAHSETRCRVRKAIARRKAAGKLQRTNPGVDPVRPRRPQSLLREWGVR